MKQTIIGLCGPKGSGKSTLAKQLVTSNPNFLRLPFAKPLKLMIETLLIYQGATAEEVEKILNGDLKEIPTDYLDGVSPRLAMQTLGTEWRNLISLTLWTNAWKKKAEIELSKGNSLIVDDMRFLHEAEVIKSFGGHNILIGREGFTAGVHLSESEHLKIPADLYIYNTENTPDHMLKSLNHYLEILS